MLRLDQGTRVPGSGSRRPAGDGRPVGRRRGAMRTSASRCGALTILARRSRRDAGRPGLLDLLRPAAEPRRRARSRRPSTAIGRSSLRESGTPAERRLARAFNAASGAFVQVEARAAHDRLTGVANRETLLTTLSSEIERATRHHKWLSVAFIDIDRFKPINDTYGHHTGDGVLREIAAPHRRQHPSQRPLRPLRRRGVHADPAGDDAGGGDRPGRASARTGDGSPAPDRRQRQVLQVTISIGIAGDVGSQLQADRLVDQADARDVRRQVARPQPDLSLSACVDDDAPVRRAPISAERRAAATAIGQWASDTAAEALASVLAPQPHHRGQPSDMIASLATGMALRAGAAAGRDRADPDRQPAARPRQAGRPARDPGQARAPSPTRNGRRSASTRASAR